MGGLSVKVRCCRSEGHYARCRREKLSGHTGLVLAVKGKSRSAGHLTCFVLFVVVDSRVDGEQLDWICMYGTGQVCDSMHSVEERRHECAYMIDAGNGMRSESADCRLCFTLLVLLTAREVGIAEVFCFVCGV